MKNTIIVLHFIIFILVVRNGHGQTPPSTISWGLTAGYSTHQFLYKDELRFPEHNFILPIYAETEWNTQLKGGWKAGLQIKTPVNSSLAIVSGMSIHQFNIERNASATITNKIAPILLLEEWEENYSTQLWHVQFPLLIEKTFGHSRLKFNAIGGVSLDYIKKNKETVDRQTTAYYLYETRYDENCNCWGVVDLDMLNTPLTSYNNPSSWNANTITHAKDVGFLLGAGTSFDLSSKNRLNIGYQFQYHFRDIQSYDYSQLDEPRVTKYRLLSHNIMVGLEFLPSAPKQSELEMKGSFLNDLLIGADFQYYMLNKDHNQTTSGVAINFNLIYFMNSGIGAYIKYSNLYNIAEKSPFRREDGFSADLGLAYRITKYPIYLRSGFSAINTSNSDGSKHESTGFHLGLGTMIPINKRIGFHADFSPKWWVEERIDYSLETGVGFVIRFFGE